MLILVYNIWPRLMMAYNRPILGRHGVEPAQSCWLVRTGIGPLENLCNLWDAILANPFEFKPCNGTFSNRHWPWLIIIEHHWNVWTVIFDVSVTTVNASQDMSMYFHGLGDDMFYFEQPQGAGQTLTWRDRNTFMAWTFSKHYLEVSWPERNNDIIMDATGHCPHQQYGVLPYAVLHPGLRIKYHHQW